MMLGRSSLLPRGFREVVSDAQPTFTLITLGGRIDCPVRIVLYSLCRLFFHVVKQGEAFDL